MKYFLTLLLFTAPFISRGQSQITEVNGLVGIGNPSPTQKLDVNGNVLINGAIMSTVNNPDIGGMISLINPAKMTPGTAKVWNIYNMSGGYGNSLQFWAYDNQSCAGGLCLARFTIMDNGNVGIGTSRPQSLLAVAGLLTAQKVKVTLNGWADHVFDPAYNLLPLSAVEQHISRYKHLPDIPSAAEIAANGLDLGSMQQKHMQKIEELTLYIIEQQKEIRQLQETVKQLAATVNSHHEK